MYLCAIIRNRVSGMKVDYMAVVNRKRLSTSLSHEHFNYLNDLCEENRQKQSAIVEIALDLLKKELETKNLSEVIEYIKR